MLGRDEVASLLERIPATNPLEVRDRALFELAYSCGLRADELVSLDLEDIEFESETVRTTGKGRKTRVVPIGEPAQRALRRYLESAARAALLRRRWGAHKHVARQNLALLQLRGRVFVTLVLQQRRTNSSRGSIPASSSSLSSSPAGRACAT